MASTYCKPIGGVRVVFRGMQADRTDRMVAPARIDVSHPGGNALARHLFAAVVAAGYAGDFYTGVYARSPEGGGLLRSLPAPLRDRIVRELKRRHDPEIPASRVKAFPFVALPHLMAAKLGMNDRILGEMCWYRDQVFDRRVAREIGRDGCDVFIGHDTSSLESLRQTKAKGGVAVLNQVVGFIRVGTQLLADEALRHPEFAEGQPAGVPVDRITHCRQEILEADRILVPSDYVRQTLLAEGVRAENIVLLPYGVDVNRFAPGVVRKSGPVRLLFVGQIGLRKGVPDLLKALRLLGRSDIELTLVGTIIGSGKGLEPYRDLFRHVAQVPYHEVHSLFQQADIFIFPSLHEGSAFVVNEALASGLPVITTANAGSLVRHEIEGLIVPVQDSHAIAAAIARLADDPILREEMGSNARRRAEAHTWQSYRIGLARFLENCLRLKHPGEAAP